jgi:hypothetical protein
MRGNPVFPVAAFLDCFAALAMTKGVRKSCSLFLKRGHKNVNKMLDEYTHIY